MPVKRALTRRTAQGIGVPRGEDSRDGEGEGGGAVQDDVRESGGAGDGDVGVDRVPDARALGVDVGEPGGERHGQLDGARRHLESAARFGPEAQSPLPRTRRRGRRFRSPWC